jgi:hypothetical protein
VLKSRARRRDGTASGRGGVPAALPQPMEIE